MKHLRNGLLITTILLHGESFAAAPADDYSLHGSPVRPPHADIVKPTPGEKVAQRQSEVFVRAQFAALFGEEAVEKLGVNWEALGNAKLSFEHSDKRKALHTIKDFLRRQARSNSSNPVFESLYADVLRLSDSIILVHEERIEEHTKRYFSRLFPGREIMFQSKKDGDQLGTIAAINSSDGIKHKFYVKTHSNGLKTSHSSGSQKLDPIELLVYKVLEIFGVGCETHFFGRDESNFYIATKDANSDGRFAEYSKVDRKKKESTAPLWGALSAILLEDDRVNEGNSVEIEGVITRDPLAQNFIHQMSVLDALARLMILTDLQTNGSNFGFIQNDAGLPTLKVIDFRLGDVTRTEDYNFTEPRFHGFLVGNGLFNYATADVAVCYALRNRPRDLRVIETLNVFKSEFFGWEQKIEHAERETTKALSDTPLPPVERVRLISEIEGHAEILKRNFGLFESLLKDYSGAESK